MNRDKIFLIGVDSLMSDILPWCFNNIRKHNPNSKIGIVALDNLSHKTYRWINDNADYFKQYDKHKKFPWFLKPKVILDCPFEYVCWVDIDCEVLKNIEDIFDYCEDGKIGLTKDVCRKINNEYCFATGVIAIKNYPYKSPLLKKWDLEIKDTDLRGDQEVLHNILENEPLLKNEINIMPIEYQWLRLLIDNRKEDNPKKKIMHWTGALGKDYIRKNLI